MSRIERLREKTFYKADDQKHGSRAALGGLRRGEEFAGLSIDYVDGKKIGIMGGSYGGYMVLAALAFKPEEFNAGVDIFGVSNWVRTLQSIPPYWEAGANRYAEIGDQTHSSICYAKSRRSFTPTKSPNL